MNYQQLGVDVLKVDQTAIPTDNSNYILISNINIPQNYLDNLQPILERVRQFIQNEYYIGASIEYQFTATYTLRHTETGELRHWVGSFFPSGNNRASLSNFRQFGFDFIPHALNCLQRQNIINNLQWQGLNSKWVFDRLESIIVNVQAIVPIHYHVLRHRQLLGGANAAAQRRHRRNHVTFHLP